MSEQRALRFDQVAEDYDRARPTYPSALLDEAVAQGDLGPGSRVLEVGSGTGKLTRALVERGLVVDAVDPGARMVEVAQRSLPANAATFHVGRFEDVDLPERHFDAVFSATAFHWIDPAVGWAKAALVLRPGGLLALLTHIPAGDPIDREFREAWRAVVPEAWTWDLRDADTVLAGAAERRDNVSEVWAWVTNHELGNAEAAPLFDDARATAVVVPEERTAEQTIALVRTTSVYLGLHAESREALERRLTEMVERAGGILRTASRAVLVTARAR